MANETLQTRGSYATVQAASSTADATLCTGTITTITSAITTEGDYPLLDLRLHVSVGAPVAGGTVDIYRRPGDGTNQAPAPQTADYLHQYAGSMVLDNATGYYYLYGVANPDPNDSYYMVNNGGATLTIALDARGRTYGTA